MEIERRKKMEKMNKFLAVFVRFGEKAGKSYLYVAPYFADLERDDTVIVEHSDGSEGKAIVVYTERLDKRYASDARRWESFKLIAGADEPKRVKAEIKRTDYEYEEDEDEE